MARSRVGFRLLGLVALAGIVAAGWFVVTRSRASAEARAHAAAAKAPTAPSAEVIAPKPGGIDRICTQPGTIEPFESVDLYAKISGYLIEQKVDIGSRVVADEVVARLFIPEAEKQAEKDAAEVKRAEAKLGQTAAAITTAEAEVRAATAAVALSQAEQKSKSSYRAYRAKQRDRVRELLAQRAIDAKLVDEQEDQYEAAVGAELAAGEAVNAAKQKQAAVLAKVEQARADQKYAEAEVSVAKFQAERSAVLVNYAVIKSPITGVITRRNFRPGPNRTPGDFVKSAEQSGAVPLLSVEGTDVMRLVVQVPDRDVPFVNIGDTAKVELDAIAGQQLQSPTGADPSVSRSSESEDPRSRMMRTEIDLMNPGNLRRGMYGKVTMNLQTGAPTAVRVSSSALLTRADGGKGTVRVVRDSVLRTIPVRYGTDNGVEVEILSGLTTTDRVVLRVNGTVDDGATVTVNESHGSTSKSSGH